MKVLRFILTDVQYALSIGFGTTALMANNPTGIWWALALGVGARLIDKLAWPQIETTVLERHIDEVLRDRTK